MAYKAIGFDYGGVIYGRPGSAFNRAIAELLGVTTDEVRKIYFQNNHRTNIGEISWEDVWKHIAVELDRADQQDAIVNLITEWEKGQKLNHDVIKLIIDLRSAGYIIGLLSNYNSGLRQKLEEQGIISHFDVIGISSEMGVMKPHAEAFSQFCNMLEVQSEELIYIDDTQKSLETANAVGYTPILFQDSDSLIKELMILKVI